MIKPVFYITILLFVLLNHSQAQQNLIYNGDFEEYSSCPQYESSPFQNPKEIEKCLGWRAPTYGTSDYFNTCATNPTISIPSNALGIQNPYSGNGYVGGSFTNYGGGAGSDGYSGIMWWEYIQGRLISPLEVDKIYKLSMEISLAEYSDLMINEIGAYFSDSPISSPNTAALAVNPQCVFYDSNHFEDTLNWVHIEAVFIASGNEQFITIGNFRNNIQTDTLRRYNLEPSGQNPLLTYFYIDHAVLTISDLEIPNVFTPNNDQLNDFWFPGGNNLTSWTCEIFNRWGNSVYKFSDSDPGWKGLDQNGKELVEGVYYYRMYDETEVKSGCIQLIR